MIQAANMHPSMESVRFSLLCTPTTGTAPQTARRILKRINTTQQKHTITAPFTDSFGMQEIDVLNGPLAEAYAHHDDYP